MQELICFHALYNCFAVERGHKSTQSGDGQVSAELVCSFSTVSPTHSNNSGLVQWLRFNRTAGTDLLFPTPWSIPLLLSAWRLTHATTPPFSSLTTISISLLGTCQLWHTTHTTCQHSQGSTTTPSHLRQAHGHNSGAPSPPFALEGISVALTVLLFYRISTFFLNCSKYSITQLITPLHQTSHSDFLGGAGSSTTEQRHHKRGKKFLPMRCFSYHYPQSLKPYKALKTQILLISHAPEQTAVGSAGGNRSPQVSLNLAGAQ